MNTKHALPKVARAPCEVGSRKCDPKFVLLSGYFDRQSRGAKSDRKTRVNAAIVLHPLPVVTLRRRRSLAVADMARRSSPYEAVWT